jgi:PAS domain S-box-containing protein
VDNTLELDTVTEHAEDELTLLRKENAALRIGAKKLSRTIKLLESQIERTRINMEARESVSRLIAIKRSELERYMDLLLTNCPDMILLFDKANRIVYCTDSFLSMCGISVISLVYGKSYRDLIAPYATPEFLEQLDQVFQYIQHEKTPIAFDDNLDFRCDGNQRTYNIHAAPMKDENGTVEGAMLTFTDTTDIRLARQAAERANAAKSDFLATVSHEIRTPMNAIIGVSGMMQDTSLTEKQLSYMQQIQNSSEVLLQLINDILDFSKIEAGKLELIEGYFDFRVLLHNLESMFGLLCRQKGLRFLCKFDENLPRVVYGDDKRIRQVLTNILNNAMKYTREGSVRFRVFKDPDGWTHFSVIDTGVGIMKEALPRLFNEFEQLDTVKNKGISGTGLGLAITKRLCLLMGGEVSVESTYGRGSRFTVDLKLREGTDSDLPRLTLEEISVFHAPEARVLLVDDIEVNLQITEYMLSQYGVQTDRATSGQEAIDMVEKSHYHLILMDHMMPEMDGVEATHIIRAEEDAGVHVPIVALTANAVSGAMEMFLANGFDDFLSKPIDGSALCHCLLKWLPQELIHPM